MQAAIGQRQGVVAPELLARKDEALLLWRDTFGFPQLILERGDRVPAQVESVDCDGSARSQRLHKEHHWDGGGQAGLAANSPPLAGAERAIVVATPEVSSIRDADRAIALIEKENRDLSPQIIVNRYRTDLVERGEMLDLDDIWNIFRRLLEEFAVIVWESLWKNLPSNLPPQTYFPKKPASLNSVSHKLNIPSALIQRISRCPKFGIKRHVVAFKYE